MMPKILHPGFQSKPSLLILREKKKNASDLSVLRKLPEVDMPGEWKKLYLGQGPNYTAVLEFSSI